VSFARVAKKICFSDEWTFWMQGEGKRINSTKPSSFMPCFGRSVSQCLHKPVNATQWHAFDEVKYKTHRQSVIITLWTVFFTLH
jgi:hypothetical protein